MKSRIINTAIGLAFGAAWIIGSKLLHISDFTRGVFAGVIMMSVINLLDARDRHLAP